MAVFKRKDSDTNWFIEFTVGGETVRRSSGTASKTAAKALEAEWRKQLVDRVRLGKAPTITLGEACIRYYETVLKPTGNPKSLKRDLGYLKQIKDAFGADTKLTDIKQHAVAKWRDDLVTVPRIRTGRKKPSAVKPASANRSYTVLRAIINIARDEWHVEAPTLTLTQLDAGPDRVRYLTDSDEAKLLLALSPHVQDFVTFLMDSGARKGEAEQLTWDRITWAGERATVRLFATDTKAERSRQVPLTMRAGAILKRLHERYHNHGYVFMYRDGEEVRRIGNIRKAFETALKRSGVKPVGGTDFRIHDLRHHFASRLAQRGATLQEIKELLGHADIAMTMRYSHLCQSNLETAIALLD
jgi:integrase